MFLCLLSQGGDEGSEDFWIDTGGYQGNQTLLGSKTGLSIYIESVGAKEELDDAEQLGIVKGLGEALVGCGKLEAGWGGSSGLAHISGLFSRRLRGVELFARRSRMKPGPFGWRPGRGWRRRRWHWPQLQTFWGSDAGACGEGIIWGYQSSQTPGGGRGLSVGAWLAERNIGARRGGWWWLTMVVFGH